MVDLNQRLRRLPAVNALLEHSGVAKLLAEYPRAEVVAAVRRALDAARDIVRSGTADPSDDDVVETARRECVAGARAGLRRVVNATGIVLHTGLGRAVLPQAAMDALAAEAGGYCLLAVDDETNKRARRERFCDALLQELTGSEWATVVNNNAAATMLALNTAAAGREVIVSRGQLVEIGGSFRMPDVMEASGCTMVDVGCTNRTRVEDYENAITENTAALIRVHPSNYRVQGFTAEVSLEEMVALGKKHDLVVIDDLGAGALIDLGPLFDEPLVSGSIAAGADLITCSADKLIGGAQGGIILGSHRWVRACEQNQLSRALRIGKLDLIALEATLRLFRDRDVLMRDHPTSRMLSETVADVDVRGQELVAALAEAAPSLDVTIEDGESYAGSGALPIKAIPSRAVVIDPPDGMSAGEAARRLRTGDPSVFVRVKAERLLIDPRTLQPGEIPLLVAALSALSALSG